MSLEEPFNLVNYSDKTEPEPTKNSATCFSTIIELVCTLLTKATVFSHIFKNKTEIHKICFKCNSIRELFGVLEFPESNEWGKKLTIQS